MTVIMKKQNKLLGTMLCVLVVLMIVFVGVRAFFIDWYTVSGDSMTPTYQDGQVVFGHKVGSADRFDVVIVKADDLVGEKRIIKRVVAFEGEEVWTQNGVLHVLSNGELLSFENEDYGKGIIAKMPVEIKRQVVPQGCVFVLGDNRVSSLDSRFFGAVSVDLIEAVVF